MSNLSVPKLNSAMFMNPLSTDWNSLRRWRNSSLWDTGWNYPVVLHNEEHPFQPHCEMIEAKDCYLFKADLPGVRACDLELTLSGNRLFIGGIRHADEAHKDDSFYIWERTYGSFCRGFTLPEGVNCEGIAACLCDGVLTVTVPKLSDALARKIPLTEPRVRVS
jgi:HSP20 family protein